MNKEIEAPVKIKIKSQKGGFDVIIKARVSGSEAVPLADMFIEELRSRGFETLEDKPSAVEVKDTEKESEPAIPICPTHYKELVKRKGQYGDFWACPSRDEDGNWCRWRPEQQKKKTKQ